MIGELSSLGITTSSAVFIFDIDQLQEMKYNKITTRFLYVMWAFNKLNMHYNVHANSAKEERRSRQLA